MNNLSGKNEKYCIIQIDMDDNQWVLPRQRNLPYNIAESGQFLNALINIKKYLEPYPVTIFLVGLDMTVKEKVDAIKVFWNNRLDVEIANHSFSHCNNFCLLSEEEKKKEIAGADNIIREALELDCLSGFRSPGYIFNKDIMEFVKNMGYVYDASLFPSYFGPILRNANYFLNGVPGKDNFGHFKDGFLPNEPFLLDEQKRFFELNVSVCPVLRVPIHYSIIKYTSMYKVLAGLIKKIKFLSFIFHLYDFLNVDIIKLKYVLQLITFERKVILAKDVKKYLSEKKEVMLYGRDFSGI